MRIPIQQAVVEVEVTGDSIVLVVNGERMPILDRQVGIRLVFGTRECGTRYQDRGDGKKKPTKGPGVAKAGLRAPSVGEGIVPRGGPASVPVVERKEKKRGCQSLASRRKLSASLRRYHANKRRQERNQEKKRLNGMPEAKRLNGAGSPLRMN